MNNLVLRESNRSINVCLNTIILSCQKNPSNTDVFKINVYTFTAIVSPLVNIAASAIRYENKVLLDCPVALPSYKPNPSMKENNTDKL